MKTFKQLMVAISSVAIITSANAQIKNSKTVTVNINGNCDMCKKAIETAAFVKKVAAIDWNKDTHLATLTYDSTKTTKEDVLKRVALAGYDNETFLAPDAAYANLSGCCQYDRKRKIMTNASGETGTVKSQTGAQEKATVNQFKTVFDAYFELKEALVKTDFKTATLKARDLSAALTKIDMMKLEPSQHEVWMKVYKDLIAQTDAMVKAKDIEIQRSHFSIVSDNLYELAKVVKPEATIYYQHCPMYQDGKGANWLSVEKTIKNPYYGSQMLSCGKTIETIK